MRVQDVFTLFLYVVAILFTILTLVPGYTKGVLEDVAIIQVIDTFTTAITINNAGETTLRDFGELNSF